MTKLSIAAVAALVTLSAPAFAGDQDLATLQADSGRVTATAPARALAPKAQPNRTVSKFQAIDAYASAAPAPRTARSGDGSGQFQGSNEATRYTPSY